MTTLTCPLVYCMRHVAVPLTAARTTSSSLHSCTHHVALPLVSPCPLWLHTPRRCACVTVLLVLAYPLLVSFLFSFSANFFFCSPVTALSPSLPTDARLSSPSRAYHGATTDHNDNATTMMT